MLLLAIKLYRHFPPAVCDDCDTLHHGDCPVHGPLRTLDQTNTYDKASLTYTNIPVPVELTVRTSGIPNAGCGVFANQFIPRGVRVGPYEGKVIPKDDLEDGRDTNYMWEVSLFVMELM